MNYPLFLAALLNSHMDSHLIPGLLIQIHTAVQWDSINQLHGDHARGGELIDDLRYFKYRVSFH